MRKPTRSMLAASLRCTAMLAAGLSVVLPANAIMIRSLESSADYRGANAAHAGFATGIRDVTARDRNSVVDSAFGVDSEGPLPATMSVVTGRVGQSFGLRDSMRFSLIGFKANAGLHALELYVPAGGTGTSQALGKSANEGLTGRIKSPGTAGGSISVPEPGTLALFGLGLTVLGLLVRRRRST